jgi:hypothetical protein
LGTVIRGSTPHFDYIASEVSKGIAKVSLESGIPIIFGVITADTIEHPPRQDRESLRKLESVFGLTQNSGNCYESPGVHLPPDGHAR